MIKEAIVKIVNKEDLTYDEAYTVMNEIMSGETYAHPERRLPCGPVDEKRQSGDHRRNCRLCGGHEGARHEGGDRHGTF